MRPVILTKKATFAPLARARGSMTGECEVVGDHEPAVAKMQKRFKADEDIGVTVYDEDRHAVGRCVLSYYVRLMNEERLEKMAALSNGMAGWS